jgi:AraC-like DNA-binding protein
VINPEWAAFGRKYWYYLSFSALFYGLSIGGYVNTIRSSVSFSQFKKPDEEPEISGSARADYDLPVTSDPEFTRLVEDADMAVWKEKIEQLVVNEKLYEDQALSVYQLAGLLHTHPKKISQVVNQGFGMNFNDYVNQQRVNAIIRRLQAGEHGLQTLLSLAFESGFNSKSTFNRAFRKFTGQTPNEFTKKSL